MEVSRRLLNQRRTAPSSQRRGGAADARGAAPAPKTRAHRPVLLLAEAVARPHLDQVAAALGGDIGRALERLRLPAHILDRQGRFRWQNDASVALIGERRGEAFLAALAPEARQTTLIELTKTVLGTEHATDYRTVVLLRGGGRLPVTVHSVAIHGEGVAVGVFAILTVPPEPPLPERESPLTPRQHEILAALAEGRSTAQIAEALSLSRETVRNHVRGLLQALRVHSRLEAVAEGRRRGLIP
jgi:DNA-binding CsgD family transcriptional regulator